MERVKTAFVLVGSGSGGLENYLIRLFDYSSSLQATVRFTNSTKGVLHNRFEEKANKIEYFDLSSPLNIKSHWRFARHLEKEKYVNLIDFRGTASGLTMLLTWLYRVPNRIVFFRTAGRRYAYNISNKLKEKWSLFLINSFASNIFSNSDSVKLTYNLTESKYEFIPNAVELKPVNSESVRKLRMELGIKGNHVVVGNVSRKHPDKNHSLLFEIFQSLLVEIPDAVLLCVGRDYDSDVPKEIVDKCIFIDYTDEIQNYYALMDVFFFPSKLEGYPNVIVEALISGLPVVASEIPQVVELKNKYPSINLFGFDNREIILDLLIEKLQKHNKSLIKLDSPHNYDIFLNHLQ